MEFQTRTNYRQDSVLSLAAVERAQRGEVTEGQRKDMRETFELLDENNDGYLSLDELEKLVRYMGMVSSGKDLNDLMKAIDKNGNGQVEYSEFEDFVLQNDILKNIPDESNYDMMNAFKVFDKDGNGYIDKEELRVVLTSVGEDKMVEEEVDEFLKAADLNGDGKIDYKEYCRYITAQMDGDFDEI